MSFRPPLLLTVFLVSSMASAQTPMADSVSAAARECTTAQVGADTACLRSMYRAARAWFQEQELDSCLAWADRAAGSMEKMSAGGMPDAQLDPHRLMNEKLRSMANNFATRYPESLRHAQRMEVVAERMHDTASQAAAMNYQGYCYRGMGETRRAFGITLKAVQLLEQLPPASDLSNAYDGLAVLCKELDMQDSAKYFQRLAITTPNENPGNVANSLLAMAEIHLNEGSTDSAAFFVAKAEPLIAEQSPVSISHFHAIRGKVRFYQHQYAPALADLALADSISTELENIYELTYIRQLQGLCLAGLGGTKNAYDKITEALGAQAADMDIDKVQELTEVRMQFTQAQKDVLVEAEHGTVKAQRLLAIVAAVLLAAIAALIWNGARRSRASATALLAKNKELLRTQTELVSSENALATLAVRTHVAQDIHDELGSQLTKIGLLSREALYARTENPEELSDLLSSIDRIALSTGSSLSEVVWNTDPHNDRISSLLDRAVEHARHMLHNTGTTLRYERGLRMADRDVPPDWRRNAIHIVKEAINNALKYAKATELYLGIIADEGHLVVEIKDNGKVFEPFTARHGNGLVNMRERAERVGGTCTIVSGNTGTTIKAVLPLP
ncbi:MAG: sensor histidine kinase [Flavobacteriales bacterium]